MVNHSTLSRSRRYDHMNILTWTILKKAQILNGCETFAFKYMFWLRNKKLIFKYALLSYLPFLDSLEEDLSLSLLLSRLLSLLDECLLSCQDRDSQNVHLATGLKRKMELLTFSRFPRGRSHCFYHCYYHSYCHY